MENPIWMLVPWLVFALGAGIKFWRLTTLFRKHLLGIPSRTERFRQSLERIWEKDQQAVLTWTPETEPALMRASPPARLGQEKPHETQAPHSRADHPQAAHR